MEPLEPANEQHANKRTIFFKHQLQQTNKQKTKLPSEKLSVFREKLVEQNRAIMQEKEIRPHGVATVHVAIMRLVSSPTNNSITMECLWMSRHSCDSECKASEVLFFKQEAGGCTLDFIN